MIGFNFYLEKMENAKVMGIKTLDFLGDFVKELYDAGLLKIAKFETVDIGSLNNEYYRAECKLWNATPDPEELGPSYEERVILLTEPVRIFLTAFLMNKIEEGTKKLSETIKNADAPSKERGTYTERVARQAQWLGRLSELLEAAQDKRYRFFTIE